MSTGLYWDDLVTAALLGTERRPFTGVDTAPAGAGGLDALVAGATDLADAAGVVWALAHAGRVPLAPSSESVVPAPDDDRPVMAAPAVRAFRAILGDARLRPVLDEWLELAAATGARLPGEVVPQLLDASSPGAAAGGPAGVGAGPGRVAAARVVAGPLGAWLAAQNPAWAWMATDRVAGPAGAGAWPVTRPWTWPDLEQAWAGGDLDRVAAFTRARSADPDLARRYLRAVWPSEPASTRAALVSALAAGLSLADEELLESLAHERRRDVRLAATGLLGRLPGSAYMADAAARSLGRVRASGSGRLVVEVDPDPDEPIEVPVGTTELARWPQHLGRPPQDLVAAALRSGHTGLVRGWTAAAAAQGDPEWARALIEGGAPPVPELFEVLPGPVAEQLLGALVAEGDLTTHLTAVARRPRPWSAAFTAAVMAALRTTVASGETARHGPVRDALPGLALSMHPDGADEAAALPEVLGRLAGSKRVTAQGFWGRRLAELAAVLGVRQFLHREMGPGPGTGADPGVGR